MIVPALHLDAALRGVDVSTAEKMRLFAEEEVIKLRRRWNEEMAKTARLEAELREARKCPT